MFLMNSLLATFAIQLSYGVISAMVTPYCIHYLLGLHLITNDMLLDVI